MLPPAHQVGSAVYRGGRSAAFRPCLTHASPNTPSPIADAHLLPPQVLMTLREEDLLRLGVSTGHARKMVLRLPELFGGTLSPLAHPRAQPSAQQPSAPAPPAKAPARSKFMPARPVPRLAVAPCAPV